VLAHLRQRELPGQAPPQLARGQLAFAQGSLQRSPGGMPPRLLAPVDDPLLCALGETVEVLVGAADRPAVGEHDQPGLGDLADVIVDTAEIVLQLPAQIGGGKGPVPRRCRGLRGSRSAAGGCRSATGAPSRRAATRRPCRPGRSDRGRAEVRFLIRDI